MKALAIKIKDFLKFTAIFTAVFIAIFFISLHLANVDLHPKKEVNTNIQIMDIDTELRKRIGAVDLAILDGANLSYSEWANKYGLGSNAGLDEDLNNSGLPNYLKYVYLIDPLSQNGSAEKKAIENGFDPAANELVRPNVEIIINKISVSSPMIWSISEEELAVAKDLEKGVSHYAGSAIPGQKGNAIISGHSSNYFWAKGDYNHIFERLGDLNEGDIIDVRFTLQNGRIITYHYKVIDEYITSADDQKVFEQTDTSTLTLSTCWPIGTNLKRLIIKAKLLS